MIRKYHNHKLQTNPWHREVESHNNDETPGRQTKQSNQLSLPHQDDYKTRMAQSHAQQNIEQLQNRTWEQSSTTNQQQHLKEYCAIPVLYKKAVRKITIGKKFG